MRLAAELGLRVWILQEQSSGAGVQVPSQKGAESGCRHTPLQLIDGKLAGTNKAKAVSQVESPTLGTSLVTKLSYAKEPPFHQILL